VLPMPVSEYVLVGVFGVGIQKFGMTYVYTPLRDLTKLLQYVLIDIAECYYLLAKGEREKYTVFFA